MKGVQFALNGPERGLWTVYGLEKGIPNGPVKWQLVTGGPENAIL